LAISSLPNERLAEEIYSTVTKKMFVFVFIQTLTAVVLHHRHMAYNKPKLCNWLFNKIHNKKIYIGIYNLMFGTMSLEPSNANKAVKKDSFLRFWWWRY